MQYQIYTIYSLDGSRFTMPTFNSALKYYKAMSFILTFSAISGCIGDKGADGSNSLIVVEEAATSLECANGGKNVITGEDTDGDGVLNEEELVTATQNLVCNGINGLENLIIVTPYTGTPCATTGNKIEKHFIHLL